MSGIEILPLSDAENEQLGKLYTSVRDLGQSFIRTSPGNCVLPASYGKYKEQIYNLKIRPSDTFVLTWAKNGTTWTQEMVWCIQNNCDFETARKQFGMHRVEFLEVGLILDFMSPKPPGMSFDEVFGRIGAAASPRVIKSHLPYDLLPPDLLDQCKVVTCMRNPKDTVVSFYHHDRLFKHHGYIGDFEAYFNLFMENMIFYCPYWDYTLEAWRRKDHPNLCLLFYEDMKKDLEGCIRKVAKFLGKDLTDEQVVALKNHLSFKKMKESAAEHEHAMKKNTFSENAKEDDSFFRKGEVGDWKNYFTEEMNKRMDAAIEKHLKGTGLEFRYE